MISLSTIRWFFLVWIGVAIVSALFRGKLKMNTFIGWIDTFCFIIALHLTYLFDKWLDKCELVCSNCHQEIHGSVV